MSKLKCDSSCSMYEMRPCYLCPMCADYEKCKCTKQVEDNNVKEGRFKRWLKKYQLKQ